jgi:hypothetical protein
MARIQNLSEILLLEIKIIISVMTLLVQQLAHEAWVFLSNIIKEHKSAKAQV